MSHRSSLVVVASASAAAPPRGARSGHALASFSAGPVTFTCVNAFSAATPTARTRSRCAASSTTPSAAAAAASDAIAASTAAYRLAASSSSSPPPSHSSSPPPAPVMSAVAASHRSASRYRPRRTSVTSDAAARDRALALAGTVASTIASALPHGRDSELRRRSRSSATTSAAGVSAATFSDFFHPPCGCAGDAAIVLERRVVARSDGATRSARPL